jgi:thiamine-phosphate pyrophosphorylase
MIDDGFGFYGILTDPEVGYVELARLMVTRRVRFVQLRMKGSPREEVREVALALREVVRAPSLLIINDDPELAAGIGADGVHLGQDDMPYAEARAIVGAGAVIGLSTHNVDQTRAACALGPDYIGVGPVYPTPTKAIPDPAIGIGGMRVMLAAATVPAVVLGSIDHETAPEVLRGGARNISAVRCVNRSADPGRDLDRMIRAIEAHRAN